MSELSCETGRVVLRPVREVTAEMENFRSVPFITNADGTVSAWTSRRDPVEPEPVGTYDVMVFRVAGYDPDCDGSLMARLEHVNRTGESTGWEPTHLGLYPDTDLVVDEPETLWRLARGGPTGVSGPEECMDPSVCCVHEYPSHVVGPEASCAPGFPTFSSAE